MKRELTLGERRAIASALIGVAREHDARAEAVLARKREIDPTHSETTSTEDKLDDAVRARAAALTKAANQHANLADFLTRYPVSVECLVTIPEQF